MHNWKRILHQEYLHERLPQHEETVERIFKYRTLVCTGTHKVQEEKNNFIVHWLYTVLIQCVLSILLSQS